MYDSQHAVIDEFLCMVAGYALGTDVCHLMFKQSQHGQTGLSQYSIMLYIHNPEAGLSMNRSVKRIYL